MQNYSESIRSPRTKLDICSLSKDSPIIIHHNIKKFVLFGVINEKELPSSNPTSTSLAKKINLYKKKHGIKMCKENDMQGSSK